MWNDDIRRREGDGTRDPEVEAEMEVTLQRLSATLRQRALVLEAAFDRQVMAAIRRSPRWRLRAAIRWWFRPRPVSISPLGALATAGALVALALVSRMGAPPVGAGRSAGAATSLAATSLGARVVRFVVSAPGASRVNVVGDFNGWDTGATPLGPVGAGGVWTVEVQLTPGRHEYAFLIDGHEWRPDPATPRAAVDDYGSPNSVIIVGT